MTNPLIKIVAALTIIALITETIADLMAIWREGKREARQEFSEKAREKFTDVVKELKKQDE